MAFKTAKFRSWRSSWHLAAPLGAALALASGGLAASPAWAEDNGWNSFLGYVGINTQKPEDAIDYRPRPQLVVPPSRDLPKPGSKSARGADWPNDPDAIARRKAEADSRRPAPRVAVTTPSNAPSMRVHMTDCPEGAATCGDDDSFWDKMKNMFGGGKKDIVLNGVEPSREYLVEPPVGYRAPLQQQQVTAPPPLRKPTQVQQASTPGVRSADPYAKASDAPPPPPPPPEQPKEHFGLW